MPESLDRTRTYVLMFGEIHNPVAHLIKRHFLPLAEVVVRQDAEILEKLYADTPQHIKLNNEVGMDWVRRNFASFPAIVEPNLSRSPAISTKPSAKIATSISPACICDRKT